MSLRHLVRDDDEVLDDELYGAELPNGGARVRIKSDDADQPEQATPIEPPQPVVEEKPERVEP